ncbi:MAG: glycosyltransferase family 2 protein [Thermodesulfobacteriota bacterium]|nr:glycosyltransferase family 2 protein [Thermodesulfobacteriota bacterium]
MFISVVSPFFDESLILEKSVELMVANLSKLRYEWELIIVNDGSRDNSLEIARSLAERYKNNLRLISYPVNQGRGYALKQGIDTAEGDIIITTEVDSSWGDTIVQDLVAVWDNEPQVDIVVASPHMPGGGYKNVPRKRVLLSSWGNVFIRFLVSKKITMFTGMTRAYKAEVIKNLPVTEKGKEFHLEVVLKAISFGYRIAEIPCILEWKDHKLSDKAKKTEKRQSSSNINKLISTHILFGILARPVRYLWAASLSFAAVGMLFLIWAIVHLLIGQVAIFLALTSALLLIISILCFIFGVLSTQNSIVQKELWRIQQDICVLSRKMLRE